MKLEKNQIAKKCGKSQCASKISITLFCSLGNYMLQADSRKGIQ